MAILFIKSDLRLVVNLQTCVKAQQSRAYAQKVKISNLQQMARTVAYVQEHGYDSRENLSETAGLPSIPKWQKRAAMQSSLKASCEKQTSRFIILVNISPQNPFTENF